MQKPSLPMMLELPAMIEGRRVKLQLLDTRLRASLEGDEIEMLFSGVKSLQVKNAEHFLLKVKGGSSTVILQFATLGVRDLAKAIIMDAVASYETVRKAALDKNLDVKALYNSVKRSTLKNLTDGAITSTGHDPQLYLQKPASDVFSRDFLNALTQPLVDAFIEMNCSLNQFYNHFITTYFFDIKNPKGSLDRLLAERIRNSVQNMRAEGSAAGDVTLDYATRINSYSIMALDTATGVPEDTKPIRKKEIEFPPAISFDMAVSKASPALPEPQTNPLELTALSCSFEPRLVKACPTFQYDPNDFELARDICKIVYQQKYSTAALADAMEFSKSFKEMLLGQYGPESMAYAERLLPSFYKHSEQPNPI